MSDSDETHIERKPHGFKNHYWDITYSDFIGIHGESEDTYYTYWGSEKGAQTEMLRIFDDNFDGGLDGNGEPPSLPLVIARCEYCDIDLELEHKERIL